MAKRKITAEEKEIKRAEIKESVKKITFSLVCFGIAALIIYIGSLVR